MRDVFLWMGSKLDMDLGSSSNTQWTTSGSSHAHLWSLLACLLLPLSVNKLLFKPIRRGTALLWLQKKVGYHPDNIIESFIQSRLTSDHISDECQSDSRPGSFYHPLTETVQLEIVCDGHDSSCYSQEILFIEMNILSIQAENQI